MNNSTGVDASGSKGANVANTTASGNNAEGTKLVDASNSTGADVKGTTLVNNTMVNSTDVDTNGSDAKVDPINETGTKYAPNVSIENNTIPKGSDLVIILPEDATGDVTVVIGNNTIPAKVENGKAIIPTEDIPAGEYNATVTYAGNDKYIPKTINDIVTIVDDVNPIVVSADNVTKYYHGPERFYVNVTYISGEGVEGVSVNITINGVTYKRFTNENGTVSLAITLNSGVYNTTVVVEGEGTRYFTVTVLPTVNATDLTKVFRNGTQFYATFYDSNGNYLPDGTAVTFNIHGVTYTRYVRGDEGLAKLNINLEQGSYVITAINPVTGEMATNLITVIPRLIENHDLTKYYRNASQYTVKAITEDGDVCAGVEVTFNIHGVFYTRTTDANGIAKLNINLEPGDYVITAEYANCKVSNNIHVLPVLSASDMTKQYGTKDQFVATLVDGQGKPYAEQTIQFNINGVFYNRVTDSNGQAKLNINLQAGQYIITSSYNGVNVANTVTVTA